MSAWRCWAPDNNSEDDGKEFEADDGEYAACLYAKAYHERWSEEFAEMDVYVREALNPHAPVYCVPVRVDYEPVYRAGTAWLVEKEAEQ